MPTPEVVLKTPITIPATDACEPDGMDFVHIILHKNRLTGERTATIHGVPYDRATGVDYPDRAIERTINHFEDYIPDNAELQQTFGGMVGALAKIVNNELLVGITVTGPVGAVVSVANQTGTIGESGAVRFVAVQGEYTVTSELDGYEDQPVAANAERPITVACGLSLAPPPPTPDPEQADDPIADEGDDQPENEGR